MAARGGHRTRSGRRRFLRDAWRLAAAAGLVGLGLAAHGRRVAARPAQALRPPGALPEREFLGACLRCGLCVRACPYGTLRLASAVGPVAPGTPYFVARAVPCEMCEDIPCVAACPSGALDPALEDITRARMGIAVLVDHESCLNWRGLRCDVCYRVCPLIDEAITLEPQHNRRTGRHTLFIPTVHADRCTGCGKCEKSCVLEEAAIKVLPPRLARGRAGGHYRLGWEEKAKAGRPLVPGLIDLPDRLPGGGP